MYWFVTALVVLLVTGLLTVKEAVEFSIIQPIFVISALVVAFVSLCFVYQIVSLHEHYDCMNSFHPGIKNHRSSYFWALGQIAVEQIIIRFDYLCLDASWRLDSVLRPLLSPLVANIHPYALCLSCFSNRALTGLLCAGYLIIHFAKQGLLYMLEGMAGPSRLLYAALAPQYLIAYLTILYTFIYVFRERLSRSRAARRLERILDSTHLTTELMEVLMLDIDKEENLRHCPSATPAEVPTYKPASFLSLNEPLFRRAISSTTPPKVSAWISGFRTRYSDPIVTESTGFVHPTPTTPSNGIIVAKRSMFSYSRRNCERISAPITSQLAVVPHPLLARPNRASDTTNSSTTYPSLATNKPSRDLKVNSVYQQTEPSYAIARKAMHPFNAPALLIEYEAPAPTVSPSSSQESLPELVHDNAASNDSIEIQTSSDDEPSLVCPVEFEPTQEHITKKTNRTTSYGLPANFVPFRALAASVKAKNSPMYAPKSITAPALKSKDDKPAAVLKRSMWKLRSKRAKRQDQKKQTLVETQASSPTPPLTVLESLVALASSLMDSSSPDSASFGFAPLSASPANRATPTSEPEKTLLDDYTPSSSTTSSPERLELNGDVSIWSPVISPSSSQTSLADHDTVAPDSEALPEPRKVAPLPRRKPIQTLQHIDDTCPPPAPSPFTPPASVSAFSGPTAPVSMTPKELAAAMSQRAAINPPAPRANRVAPVYTLMDGARTVAPKGGVIPPKTQYQVKDAKGTSLRTTGPKGLRV